MWKEYFILNMRVGIKVYQSASHFGLPQIPRISKMEVWQFGKQLMNYDRGMDFNNIPAWLYDDLLKALAKLILVLQPLLHL